MDRIPIDCIVCGKGLDSTSIGLRCSGGCVDRAVDELEAENTDYGDIIIMLLRVVLDPALSNEFVAGFDQWSEENGDKATRQQVIELLKQRLLPEDKTDE